VILCVNFVLISTSLGKTLEYDGTNKTSSNVSACGKLLIDIKNVIPKRINNKLYSRILHKAIEYSWQYNVDYHLYNTSKGS